MTRNLPPINATNRSYWTGGREGQLLIQRCAECRRYQHPPQARCAACGGDVVAEPVSGKGTVFTFTVNTQPFHPEVPVPYVVALVELEEQEALTVPTNIIGIEPAAVSIGLPVRVTFEQAGDAWVPQFEPDGAA